VVSNKLAIGSTNPTEALEVTGNAVVSGTLYIGTNTNDYTSKSIYFGGLYGDNDYNHCVIANRNFGSATFGVNENSELILFKGNDYKSFSSTGYDRLRLKAPHITFQTFKDGINNFNETTANMSFDENGNLGIGTDNPRSILEIVKTNPSVIVSGTNEFQFPSIYLGSPVEVGRALKAAIIGSTDNPAGGTHGWSRLSLNFCTRDAFGDNTSNVSLSEARMTILPNGRIGINQNNPTRALLEVNGSVDNNLGVMVMYRYPDVSNNNGQILPYSIYASSRIAAVSFDAYSDVRIKNTIHDIDDSSALDTLRLLEPKMYRYIDTVERGDREVYGFIAQEVANVLPYAVSTGEGDIPNIMAFANVFAREDSYELFMGTAPAVTLSNASILNVITPPMMIESNVVNQSRIIRCSVLRTSNTSIFVSNTCTELQTVDDVFVKGEVVQDFHHLNKDSIFTVATAALQEVDRQLQAEKAKVATLEAQLASVLMRLDALEATS
jgi:hypothetical protein